VIVAVEPRCATVCLTLPEVAVPGDGAASCASNMYGAGMTKCVRPPSRPTNAMEPSSRWTAVSPPALTVKVTANAPAGALARTMFSFSALGVTS
jgi:hypothetical protein